VNVLSLILENAGLFSTHKLDIMLVAYLQHRDSARSELVFQLAQQVLLNWILDQPCYTYSEAAAVILLQVLGVPTGDCIRSEDSNANISGNKTNFSDFDSADERATKPVRKRIRMYDSEPNGDENLINSPHIISKDVSDTSTLHGDVSSSRNLVEEETQLTVEQKLGPIILVEAEIVSMGGTRASIEIKETEDLRGVISSDRMDLIMSSVRDISWLDIEDLEFTNNDSTDISHQELHGDISVRNHRETTESGNSITNKLKELDKISNESSLTIQQDGKVSGTIGTNIEVRIGETSTEAGVISHLDKLVPVAAQNELQGVIINSSNPPHDGNNKGERKEGNKQEEHRKCGNVLHVELLSSCRAHRASVVKATNSLSGTGAGASLSAKTLQQLNLSACSLLIRIGHLQAAPLVEASQDRDNMFSQLSQSLSQNEDTADDYRRQSLEAILLQSHTLLALSLSQAPDELLSAVSDSLLTQIDNQNRKTQRQGGQIQPVTAVIFLSGVLLVRVRTLNAPASRLLLRAVETAVKKMPALTISCLMSRITQHCSSTLAISEVYQGKRELLPGHPQFELLQRVARQALSKDQCEDIVFNMCSKFLHRRKDSNSTHFYAAACVFDALLSPLIAGAFPSSNISGNKRGHTGNNKQGGVRKSNETKTVELSVGEQDLWASRWNDFIAASCNLFSSRGDYGPGNTQSDIIDRRGQLLQGTPHWDAELLKILNTIFTSISQLSHQTMASLLEQLDLLSVSISAAPVGNHSSSSATSKATISTALISLMHTVSTRFSKTIAEAGMKKDAVAILIRFTSSVVAKTALAALQKL
jgi:hypothetical protein